MTAPLEAWRPSVDDVAALVPERTGSVQSGTPTAHGTFDSTTTPSATQVEGLIRGVQNEVAAQVGSMPDSLAAAPSGGTIGESAAGHVVALGTASLVESSFYPDMGMGTMSPGSVLESRYRLALAALVKAANDINAGALAGVPPKPVARFPDTVALGMATTFWERY